jgi:hypothetical protein
VRARADAVVKQAKAGTADDFTELVKQYSEAGTRETQGLLGPLPRADLQENIANVAFTMDQGTVSEPIDTGRSFHIIRLDARTPANTRTLADPAVKQEVHDQVRDDKYRPRFDIYLKKLWRENYIEVAPKYESYLVVSPLKIAPANEKNATLPAAPPPGAAPPPESAPASGNPPSDATTSNAKPPESKPPESKPPDARPPDADHPAGAPDPNPPASPPEQAPPQRD